MDHKFGDAIRMDGGEVSMRHQIDSGTTLPFYAIGATDYPTRSNAFEVAADGNVILKSPNGTRYKINVADDSTLTTSAV